jgi:hypothetical protein
MSRVDYVIQLIHRLNDKTSPQMDQRVLADAKGALAKTNTKTSVLSKPNLGRFIMKSPMTRLAMGVILTIGVISAVFIHGATPVYALEQTLTALNEIQFLHAVMRNAEGQATDERWIEVGSDGEQARYMQESRLLGMDVLIVDNDQTCFVYYKDKQTAVLYDSHQARYEWFNNLRQLLQDLAGQGRSGVVEIETQVPYQGGVAHRVRLIRANMNCYIDPQTHLPLAVGPYEMSYEEPSDMLFSMEIPDGVGTVDKRSGSPPAEAPQWMMDLEAVDPYFDEARAALVGGDCLTAAELFTQVVEIQPLRNWAWFWLGQSRDQLGQYDAAIYCYSRVIDLFNTVQMEVPYCRLARALVYLNRGMDYAAQEDLAVALPVMIKGLRNPEASRMFDDADDPMLRDRPDDQRPSEKESLVRMIERLKEAAGCDFGTLSTRSDPQAIEQVIQAWEAWSLR